MNNSSKGFLPVNKRDFYRSSFVPQNSPNGVERQATKSLLFEKHSDAKWRT